MPVAALENALYLGDKYVYVIGLFDIIVSSQIQSVKLVLLVRPRTDYEYGSVSIFAEL